VNYQKVVLEMKERLSELRLKYKDSDELSKKFIY
jgi:hypothetical protein